MLYRGHIGILFRYPLLRTRKFFLGSGFRVEYVYRVLEAS